MQPQTQHTELQGWQRLVGTWATEATHPALPGIVVSGQATFEWLEDQRFLIQRSHYDHPEIPDAIAVTGIIDGKPSMHYFGPRGGHRVFAVDFTADTRRCWNDAPGFSLRTADPTIAFTCRSPDTTPRISTHMPDSRAAAVPYAATTWKPFFAGGGRAGARIWRGAAGWRLAGLVRPGRGFFVPAVAVAGMIGGGLPVTPVKFGDTSPLETLAPGP